MSRGRHRADAAGRSLSRRLLEVPRPVVAAGVGTTLLGVTLTVGLWPEGAGAEPAPRAVPSADAGAALSAMALRAAAADKAAERAARNRAASPATPSATPSATPTPTPSKPAPLPKAVSQLWVLSTVNVRSGPSADTARIGSLAAGAKAGYTGKADDGWTQVLVGDRVGWVKSTYLSTTKPAPPRAPAGVSDASCSISSDVESHLSANARSVYRAVCAAYGDTVSSFGGYRPGDDGDHGSGRAVDIMVSGDPGWDIARYVQAHADELGVTYVIYQQKMWMAGRPTGQWSAMEDRGSSTANHYDHVHVSVS